uniref:Uncharacterized protein n=1 Tax=Salmonella sp. TaxID=599 RepID=A0A482EX20_SALSP|nr:hypothetical protein [Salmonella sp.]QBM91385.1 hypothetical protein NNIBIDOC_00052 [Salmonella sp.]
MGRGWRPVNTVMRRRKKNKIKDQAANTGTTKKQNIPYFEDMNFDSVIADEGITTATPLMPGVKRDNCICLTRLVSKMARDMAVKAAYMMKRAATGVV